MKYIIIALLLISSNAYADEAIWTGKFEVVKESPYENVYNCEYEINGEKGYILQTLLCEKKITIKKRKQVEQA